ncbi:hypothetical protein HFD88_009487 [Aspergillus terreus]|nr:hypothetical protein HFD88_009487 [Aspergillus terreus]
MRPFSSDTAGLRLGARPRHDRLQAVRRIGNVNTTHDRSTSVPQSVSASDLPIQIRDTNERLESPPCLLRDRCSAQSLQGAHVEFAIVPIQHDNTCDPAVFDGLRYYRMRQTPSEAHRHQFATTSESVPHFGHGQNSCPGRSWPPT